MYILLIITNLIVLGYAVYLYKQDKHIVEINKSAIAQNKEIQDQIQSNQTELDRVTHLVSLNTTTLKQLDESLEATRAKVKVATEQEYDNLMRELMVQYNEQASVLDKQYQDKSLSLQRDLDSKSLALQSAEAELENLKAKQLAYLQAQQREEEKKAKQDYYRLVISDTDKADIQLLRNIQVQLSHKDVIDKVIYETYYKQAYNILMSHLITKESKISGIYKITSLVDQKAYIGQSVDIKERIKQHIKSGLSYASATNNLYQEFKKQGLDNFTFEILEEVPKDKLNEREVYWIDFYKTKDYGMNKTRGGA